MKRSTPGYRSSYRVSWDSSMECIGRVRYSAPCLMNWAIEVAKRMRARGHRVTVVRV